MTAVIFDTNILIDALIGYPEALSELAHWDMPVISAITWIETYSGASADEMPKFDKFLGSLAFEVVPIDQSVMKAAAELRAGRRRHGKKLSLADAIITATAQLRHLTIVTRNTKDFKGRNVRVPYELQTTCTVTVINVLPPPATLNPS